MQGCRSSTRYQRTGLDTTTLPHDKENIVDPDECSHKAGLHLLSMDSPIIKPASGNTSCFKAIRDMRHKQGKQPLPHRDTESPLNMTCNTALDSPHTTPAR